MRRPQPSDLDVEMPMGVRIAQSLRRVWPLAVLLFALAPACPAETPDVSGRYQCTQAKGQGKVIAGKNPTGTQNFAALSRKTRIGRSDLRAARGGAGENGAELTGDGNQRIDLKNDVLSSVFPATRPSQYSC